MITLISILASTVYCVISFAYIMRAFARGATPRLLSRLFFELRWLHLPCAAWLWFVEPIAEQGYVGWLDWIMLVMALINWWGIRRDKDDDDRWNRRAARLKSKVAELANGGLGEVPA